MIPLRALRVSLQRPSFFFAWLTVLELLSALAPAPARAEEPVTVYYMERPPYYVTKDGQATGLLNDIARSVFEDAGLAHQFAVLPPKRILEEIARPDTRACSVGWFRSPEREAYARFSRPIYRNRPMVPLVRSDMAASLRGRSLRDILADQDLVLGVLDGFSYGTELDGLIDSLAPERYRFAGTQKQLVRMLAAGRIDYILLSPEEVAHLLADAGIDDGQLVQVEAAHALAGNVRHLMCSRGVGDDVMRRLDASIARLQLLREE